MERNVTGLVKNLSFPIIISLLTISVWVLEEISKYDFFRYGIFPREWDGLAGIISAPFIHSGGEHLWSNIVPLFVLTSMMVLFYKRIAVPSYIIIQILTGFAVWLFARRSYHIGASGVVYGLVSFVFWSGVFRRNIKSIVLALIVVILYSGYFYGIVPNKEGISWESHLFGGLVGIFTAFLFKDIREPEEAVHDPWGNEEEATQYFLPRDTFEMTRWEREQERLQKKQNWESDSTYFF